MNHMIDFSRPCPYCGSHMSIDTCYSSRKHLPILHCLACKRWLIHGIERNRKSKILHGTTRMVFLVKDWAIKIPSFVEWRLFLNGLLGNLQERKFSKTGWSELCPVVWSSWGGWIVIMKRAMPLTRSEFDAIDLEKWVSQPTEYILPVELKMDSFGWLDNKLVIVDYGS